MDRNRNNLMGSHPPGKLRDAKQTPIKQPDICIVVVFVVFDVFGLRNTYKGVLPLCG